MRTIMTILVTSVAYW